MANPVRLGLLFVLTCALIFAAYPLALTAQTVLDRELGDALLLRELKYGSQRALAGELVRAWVASLPWVLVAWLLLSALHGTLGRAYGPVALIACAAAVLAAVAVPMLPSLLVSLLIVCAALEAGARALFARKWSL
jgi:hypothetical protein